QVIWIPTTSHVRPIRRRQASFTAANASGRISSSASRSLVRRSAGSLSSASASARRRRNSGVFAARSASERARNDSAWRVISSTTGSFRWTSRSCLEPKTFLRSESSIGPRIVVMSRNGKATGASGGGRDGSARALDADETRPGAGAPGRGGPAVTKNLDLYDVRGLDAALTLSQLELHQLALVKRAELVALDRG